MGDLDISTKPGGPHLSQDPHRHQRPCRVQLDLLLAPSAVAGVECELEVSSSGLLEELHVRRTVMATHIRALKTLDERIVEKLVEENRVIAVTLSRDEISYTPGVNGDAVSVTAIVPTAGSINILAHRAERNRGPLEVPRGQLFEHRAALGKLGSAKFDHVTFSQEFPAGISPDEVKAWARRCVDALDVEIQKQAPIVAAHNDEVEKTVPRLVEQRRAALSTARSLSEGLEPGL